ncbi:uncharacterized protein [Coffea arabica]|uniref:Uncharacterized protein n=1 Tax=Coffea arabica TaxID=13443 RepID=A0ABM4X8S6_COFAR|nr:uncharacterized protein LOC113734138 [Coffea arabica]
MTSMFRRVATTLRSLAYPRNLSWAYSKFSRPSTTFPAKEAESVHIPPDNNQKGDSFGNYTNRIQLSPLCSESSGHHLQDCKIELVDNESWQMSSGLIEAWKGKTKLGCEEKAFLSEEEEDKYNGVLSYMPPNKEDPDFDEIEDMRIRGNLFYKLDKDSKEYEEHKFDFHRKKSSKNKNDQKENTKKEKQNHNVAAGIEKNSIKFKDELKEMKKKEKLCSNSGLAKERYHGVDRNEDLIAGINEVGGDFDGKRFRTPTFNQLTAPYHEPFSLDIYVSKGSVRASIIHRATSKVVAVAHSISKDMKFDLGSTKNRTACAAVGEVLAQRALADDIHNVVYTPRKGEKLEGKLQIVLQSIIDHGVNVKVKIKQRKVRKGGLFQPKTYK